MWMGNLASLPRSAALCGHHGCDRSGNNCPFPMFQCTIYTVSMFAFKRVSITVFLLAASTMDTGDCSRHSPLVHVVIGSSLISRRIQSPSQSIQWHYQSSEEGVHCLVNAEASLAHHHETLCGLRKRERLQPHMFLLGGSYYRRWFR